MFSTRNAAAYDDADLALVDANGQYADLIRRTIDDIDETVDADISYALTAFAPDEATDYDARFDRFDPDDFDAAIITGGPFSATDDAYPGDDLELGDCAYLGICYGMQLLADRLGGTVDDDLGGEFWYKPIDTADSPLFDGIDDRFQGLMSHSDRVTELPDDVDAIAYSDAMAHEFSTDTGDGDTCVIAGIQHQDRPIYGLQFHPETHFHPDDADTDPGERVYRNFLDEAGII